MDIAVFGLIVADVIAEPMALRAPPAPGGLVHLGSLTLTSGGNVCNTGVALARLGVRVAAAGRVGRDALGQAVLQRLADEGVDTRAVQALEDAQTSATVVAVEPGGERCFFHVAGATTRLDAEAFEGCFDLFAACRWLQIGYFGLLPGLTDDLPDLLARLRRRAPNLRVALDTVNPPASWALLQPILPHLDVFAPSRPEAMALVGLDDPQAFVRRVRAHMPRGIVGMKMDSAGCWLDDGRAGVHVPACPVRVVDTTGAGDTWYAGLLAGLLRGMEAADAGRVACRVAADCCGAIGATAGVRDWDSTLARLAPGTA